MAKKQIEVKLSRKEREGLQRFVAQGKKSAREINRARILLLSEQGAKDKEITKLLGVWRGTVYNVGKKYKKKEHADILDFLREEPRSGRPLEIDSTVEAKVAMIACSDPPEGCARWTLHMIADKVVKLEVLDSISHESVRGILKKTNLSPG